MAFVHGKGTVVIIDGVDISQYTKTSEFPREVDEHDVTTYGRNSHVVRGGLFAGKFTMSGFYDDTAVSGPRAKLKAILGTNVTLIRRPEGTGTGKPQDSVTVLVKTYAETSPTDDMVAWSCECTLSGDVNTTAQ